VTSTEFPPHVPVTLATGLRRITSGNASPFTGPGTNSYVLGDPAWAIVDPGPQNDLQLEALLQAAPRARWCFVTHTHGDHSPLARRYCEASGAQAVGLPPPNDGRQDALFQPAVMPAHNQRFSVSSQASSAALAEASIIAIHTPGHASNHVCYLLADSGILFSGDHVLDGVSPVILAPDGDMADYLAALRLLQTYPLQAIAPGHGRLLSDPQSVLAALIEHRLQREAQVLNELRKIKQGSTDELLPLVYADVHQALLPLARCSLDAHLIKLERDGTIGRAAGLWNAS
jgi:glyoxylase-like metal-dependent hydrolase (beta-lactamase superfamily II)